MFVCCGHSHFKTCFAFFSSFAVVLGAALMLQHLAVHSALDAWMEETRAQMTKPHEKNKLMAWHVSPPRAVSPTHSESSATASWQPQRSEDYDYRWAEEWASELTHDFLTSESASCVDRKVARSRSPKRKEASTCQDVNPWAQPSREDLLMLKSNDQLVQALHVWNNKINSVARLPKADIIVTFEPSPAVASESHLHQKIAAMGVDVFPKGSTPSTLPHGIQGGQAGQYSVALLFCKDPLIKVTVQMQRVKANVVVKGKRAMFEIAVVMMLLPVFGAPTSVCAKKEDAPKNKATAKENMMPIAKAFGKQVNLGFWTAAP